MEPDYGSEWSVMLETCMSLVSDSITTNESSPDSDIASTFGVSGGINASSNWTAAAPMDSVDMRDMCSEVLANLRRPIYDSRRYTRELLTYLLTGVAGLTVGCFGLIGNLLSAIVLTRRTMTTSTYCYLAALAVCDLLFVACTIILLIKDAKQPEAEHAAWPTSDDTGFYPYVFPYLNPAAFTLQVSSVWLTLAFTVDRYIMICHPFESEPFCTVGRARRVIAGLLTASVAFNLPKFFEYRTVTKRHPVAAQLAGGDGTVVVADLTDFGRGRVFKELYHSWFYIVFVFGVPFVALVVLNGFLVNAVRKSRQRSRDLRAPRRRTTSEPAIETQQVVAPAYQLEGRTQTISSSSSVEKAQKLTNERFTHNLSNSGGAVVMQTKDSPTGVENSYCHPERQPRTVAMDPMKDRTERCMEVFHTPVSVPSDTSEPVGSVYQLEGLDAESSPKVEQPAKFRNTLHNVPEKKATSNNGPVYELDVSSRFDTSKYVDAPNGVSSSENGQTCSSGNFGISHLLISNNFPDTDQQEVSDAGKSSKKGPVYQLALADLPPLENSEIPQSPTPYQLEGLSPGGTPNPAVLSIAPPSPVTKRIDTTVMLIGVVVIFIVCQFPALVSRVIWAFSANPTEAFTDPPLYALNEVGNFLVLLNSSVNIVPYYFFGRRFRRQFLLLLCPACCFGRRQRVGGRRRQDSGVDSGLILSHSLSHRESVVNNHI